ncbi:MAG: phage tail protein [Gemmatimonadota bacterium]
MATREPLDLLRLLPAPFQQTVAADGRDAAGPSWLALFLRAFQEVLAELETEIDTVHRTFDPDEAPGDFLEWLGGWVALSFRADLEEARRREFIRRAVTLYRRRGTRRGLEEILEVHTGLPPADVEVNELTSSFQLGVSSRIGADTLFAGGAPHFFRVRLRAPTADPADVRRLREVATAVIEAEKPAHTRYVLDLSTPTT